MSGLSPANTREDIKVLTLIRFVCAFMVLAYHFVKPTETTLIEPLRNFAMNGHLGVICFFVMSGFILNHVYPKIESATAARKFWWARVVRIAPATFVSVLFFILKDLFTRQTNPQFLPSALTSLTGIGAWTSGPLGTDIFNVVTWTISVEAFFYLLYPMLGNWAGKLTLDQLTVAMIGNSILLLLKPLFSDYVIEITARQSGFYFPILWLPFFIHGIFLRCLLNKITVPRDTLGPVALSGIGSMLFLCLPFDLAETMAMQGVFIALFSGILLLSRNFPVNESPLNRTWLFLGQASFSIYLFQFWYPMLIGAPFRRTGHPVPSILMTGSAQIIGAMVFGIAGYLLVETPARKALMAWSKGLQAKKKATNLA